MDGIDRWAWAAQDRHPGFCLTFVQDRDPATIAALLGAGELRVMTATEADQAYPITRPGSVLRLGPHPAGTFCFEDRGPVANRAPALARLSTGTRLVQVVKSGDGMTVVRRMTDGQKIEWFEPCTATAPRGQGPYLLAPRVVSASSSHPGATGLVVALAVVGQDAGVVLDRDTLDGPLPTALTTLEEPATTRPGRAVPPTAR